MKVPDGKLCFRICRVRCESCRKTHALLLSSMVPYSQISLKDQISVIDAFENDLPTAEGLRNLDSVDESDDPVCHPPVFKTLEAETSVRTSPPPPCF
ncbi:MAG: DUF6431 domain-containing protein [Agathobacter sp.]